MAIECGQCPDCSALAPLDAFEVADLGEMHPSDFEDGGLSFDVDYVRCPECGALIDPVDLA